MILRFYITKSISALTEKAFCIQKEIIFAKIEIVPPTPLTYLGEKAIKMISSWNFCNYILDRKKILLSVLLVAFLLSGCQIGHFSIPFQVTKALSNASAPKLVSQTFKNIPYLTITGVDPNLLSLDVYTPDPHGAFPVIIMIHGGSWSGGDKDTPSVSKTKSQFFTKNGIVFVSINYRLAPKYIYPCQVEDVAAAVAWVYQHISAYGGDAGKIFIMGHSAGGQLAALVATNPKYLAIYNLKLRNIRGVILLDGAGLDIPGSMVHSLNFMYTTAFGNNPNTWKKASPINYVAPGTGIPPFLVTFTYQVIPFYQTSQEFASKLGSSDVKVWTYGTSQRTHDSITDDIGTPNDPVTALIMSFMESTLGH